MLIRVLIQSDFYGIFKHFSVKSYDFVYSKHYHISLIIPIHSLRKRPIQATLQEKSLDVLPRLSAGVQGFEP